MAWICGYVARTLTKMTRCYEPVPALIPGTTAHKHAWVLLSAVHCRKSLCACKPRELHQLSSESMHPVSLQMVLVLEVDGADLVDAERPHRPHQLLVDLVFRQAG